MKDALLLNGITEKAVSLMMRLAKARGPGTFDIHEHVIVAPSHLRYYNIGSHLLMEAYEALSVEEREKFMREMRRGARHVPTRTILSSFEPEKVRGTTLSMSDYAVLITVGHTVLLYLVHSTATSPHARAALRGLKALRRFSTALFYVPTFFSDGEKAMRARRTVAELQVMGERLIIELRRLLPFNGRWERPSVNRVVELLYWTLPLAQLWSAICELIFEKFHQHSKRKVSQSNSRNPAEYSMKRWRDTEHYSRASWLLGQESQPLKSASFHSLGPHKRQSLSTNMRERPRTAARTVLGSTEEFWRSRAPNAFLAIWRQATQAHRPSVLREGSTVSLHENGATPEHESGSDLLDSRDLCFVRVQSIGTIDGELHVACETWKILARAFSVLGQPAEVTIDTEVGLSLIPADHVRQLAFVLPCGQHNVMFTKRSGFHFQSG